MKLSVSSLPAGLMMAVAGDASDFLFLKEFRIACYECFPVTSVIPAGVSRYSVFAVGFSKEKLAPHYGFTFETATPV